jgi:hypothetical protein
LLAHLLLGAAAIRLLFLQNVNATATGDARSRTAHQGRTLNPRLLALKPNIWSQVAQPA